MIRVFNANAIGGFLAISAAVLFQSGPQPAREPAALSGAEPSSRVDPTTSVAAAETPATVEVALAWAQAADPAEEVIPALPGRPWGEMGRRGRKRGQTLSPELIEQCLVVAREVEPDLADRLQELRRNSPGPAFERSLRHARHLVGLARLKERNPQLYELKVQELRLDAQVNSLVEQLWAARQASSAAAPELEVRLRELVRQQVAISITARGMYLLRLKENMKLLRDRLEHDAANFAQTVDQRMQRLIDEAQAPPESS
jgi:hypothetical protein